MVYQMLLRNVAAQFVKVLLCLLFPAVLRIPGPDPRGSRMPSNQESVVPLEERLRCDGNLSVSLCSVQRCQARHQLTGPACTQIWNSDQSGRIGPEMRAGSAQLRQRLRLRLHQAHWQGLLVPHHSPNSAVPIGNLLLLRKHKAKQAQSRGRQFSARVWSCPQITVGLAPPSSVAQGAEQGPGEFLTFLNRPIFFGGVYQ